MVTRRLLLLLLLALLGPALTPGAAQGADVLPDARAFARATLAFDLARGNAVGRAERRGDERRSAATACLETVRNAPVRARGEILELYRTHLADAYFGTIDASAARWVRALRRITLEDVQLRRARFVVARQLAATRTLVETSREFCAPVQAWAAVGWKSAATPRPLAQAGKRLVLPRASRAPVRVSGTATRVLRARGGTGAALAASVLRAGIHVEPSEVLLKRGDPIVAALGPV